jgi:hypothetical protein
MIRFPIALAVAVLIGAIGLRLAFGIFGGLIGVLFSLAWIGLKLLCVALAVYFALNIISPETARRIRDALGLEGSPTHLG